MGKERTMKGIERNEWLWIPLILLGMAAAGEGDKLSKAGRRLAEQRGACVANVALVIEMSMGGGGMDMSEEMEGETTATFLHPSGLAVVPFPTSTRPPCSAG